MKARRTTSSIRRDANGQSHIQPNYTAFATQFYNGGNGGTQRLAAGATTIFVCGGECQLRDQFQRQFQKRSGRFVGADLWLLADQCRGNDIARDVRSAQLRCPWCAAPDCCRPDNTRDARAERRHAGRCGDPSQFEAVSSTHALHRRCMSLGLSSAPDQERSICCFRRPTICMCCLPDSRR